MDGGSISNSDVEDCDVNEDWSEIWMGNDSESTNLATNMIPTVKLSTSRSPKHADTAGETNSVKHDEVPIPETSTSTGAGDSTLMSRMLLNDNKAGMEGLDKEKINKIIHEASKGSRFYKNEQKKEEQVRRRIEEQTSRLHSLTPEQIHHGILEANKLIEQLEASRDLTRTIVHVDMDMFYAAVEMRDCPKLKEKPMAVGGMSMLSTSNYVARKYGVRAAMPGFIAKKLCPDLVIVNSNFDKYKEVSAQVRDIFKDYDPNFAPMSLDEAYLDFTEYLEMRKIFSDDQRSYCIRNSEDECSCVATKSLRKCEYLEEPEMNVSEATDEDQSPPDATLCQACGKRVVKSLHWETFGFTAAEAVREMRFRIEHRTRLTASAGIAPNTMLSKVCSDKNKPNGQYQIPADVQSVRDFVSELPIRKVGGIGKVSEQMLSAIDVKLCPDVLEKRGIIYHLYSPISFNYFIRIALGISSTTVEKESERKSMSVERTFSEINKPSELLAKCHDLCVSLSADLKSENLTGRTVTLKLKTVEFELRTRALSVPLYTNETDQIYKAAAELMRIEINGCAPRPLRLRLMGVRMSSFDTSKSQSAQGQKTIKDLFKASATSSKREASASDELIKNSGSSCVTSEQPNTSTKDLSKGTILTFAKSHSDKKGETHGICHRKDTALSKTLTSQYNCPICNTDIDCDTLSAFNKHLDLCLYTCGTQSPPKGESKTSSMADHSDNIRISTSDIHVQMENGYNSRDVANDATVESGISYTCPVCSVQQHCKNLHEFNSHVDMCLSSQENSASTSTGSAKRNPDKKLKQPPQKRRKLVQQAGVKDIKSFFSK